MVIALLMLALESSAQVQSVRSKSNGLGVSQEEQEKEPYMSYQ